MPTLGLNSFPHSDLRSLLETEIRVPWAFIEACWDADERISRDARYIAGDLTLATLRNDIRARRHSAQTVINLAADLDTWEGDELVEVCDF